MEIRINRFLSDAGFCSRRAADDLIKAGRVTINGKTACLGDKTDRSGDVCVDGKPVKTNKKDILLAFHKPAGIVCTMTDKQGSNNLKDYLGLKERIYPIGRLDKDSEGLLLLTNNGDITYRMLKADGLHEKEYIVETDKPVTKNLVRRLSGGIFLKDLNKKTAKCKVVPIHKKDCATTNVFSITLVQGMNRQIRRMCESCGYKVKKLKRIRIMNILLGDLPAGKYRELTRQEYETLIKGLKPEEINGGRR